MSVSYVSTEITQQTVTVNINGDECIKVVLTYDYICVITIPDRKKLCIKDLIEICELLYTEEVIKSDDLIEVRIKGGNSINARGLNQVADAFIKNISIEVTGGSKK